MATISILPLHTIAIIPTIAWIKSQQAAVKSIGKVADAVSSIPGVGQIKALLAAELQKRIDGIIPMAKALIRALIMKTLMENLVKLPWEKFVKAVNKIIEKVNKVIDTINAAINILKSLLAPIFPIIIVLTIAYVVAKIISMIPSFGGGWGFVVTATSIGNTAGAIQTAAEKMLLELKPIPASVLSGLLQLLAVASFLAILQALITAFMAKQAAMAGSANEAANKTADDWANSSEDNTETLENFSSDSSNANLNSALASALNTSDNSALNSENILVDNMIERLSINGQMNQIDSRLSGIGVKASEFGDCHLPDGTISQLTPEDCAEAGGVFGYGSPPDNPPSPPSSPYTDGDGNVWAWVDPPGEWQLVGGPNYQGVSDEEKRDLLIMKDALGEELNKLGGPLTAEEVASVPPEIVEQVSEVFDGLGTEIITSLLNPDPNVTVEDATKNFGSRYGFYQQETTSTGD